VLDVNTVVAVGDYGTILRTTDGGATWTRQSSGTTSPLRGVSFTDANTGTAVGDKDTILRTTDGGVTWKAQSSGTTTASFRGVFFSDANIGTVVGCGSGKLMQFYEHFFGCIEGAILRTSDGGATWKAQ